MVLQLKVPKIVCGGCVNTVTKAIKDVDATAKVEINTKTKVVKIKTQQPEAEIKQAIATVGYPAA